MARLPPITPAQQSTVASTVTSPAEKNVFPELSEEEAAKRRAKLSGMRSRLSVGDRVMPGPDWFGLWRYEEGTVSAIPSNIAKHERGIFQKDWVDVKWDNGKEDCYCFGADKLYEVDIVQAKK